MPTPLLLTAGNGINPREDLVGGKVWLDHAAENLIKSGNAAVVLQASDCGSMCTNEGGSIAVGSRAFTLPAAPASATQSLWFKFYDQNGNGIQIIAAGTNTIRVGEGLSVTGAGGKITSTLIGQMIVLRSVNGTEWIAEPTTSDWSIS